MPSSFEQFEGRRALITGAASGIGLAVARTLAAAGAQLVLVDAASDRLESVVGELDGAIIAHFAGDVADERLWETVQPALDGLSLSVVNAGVAGGCPIRDLEFAEWRRMLSTNLDGVFLSVRASMRAMAGQGGAIVVTASASGLKAEPGIAAYGASKAGVLHLAKVAAKEGAAEGIRVNAIAPGGVETPIWREVPFFADLVAEKGSEAAAFDAMADMATPLGRYARPEEIAAQILFLLSEDAATMTGAVLVSDGGYTL